MQILIKLRIQIGEEWRLIKDIMKVQKRKKKVKKKMLEIDIKKDKERMIIRRKMRNKGKQKDGF